MKKILVIILFNTLGVFSLYGAELKAEVKNSRIRLYDVFEIEVKAILDKNAQVEFENFSIQSPAIRYLNNSIVQSFSSINGQVTYSRNLVIQLKALQTGAFSLGPFSAKIDNQVYRSNTVQIVVEQRLQNPMMPQSNRLSDNLLLLARADKATAFVNEQVVLTYTLLYRLMVREYSDIELQNKEHVFKEALPVEDIPNQGRVFFEGEMFMALELKRFAVFFTQAGKRKIDEQLIQCVFELEDDFGNRHRQRAQLKSSALVFDVKELPQNNQPNHFLGDVGDYSIEVDKNFSKPVVSQVFKLPVKVSGSGNLMLLAKPNMSQENSEFELIHVAERIEFDKNSRRLGGTKYFEMALRPKVAGTTELPRFSMSYFNPSTNSYIIKKTPAIKIQIENNPDSSLEELFDFRYQPISSLREVPNHQKNIDFQQWSLLALGIFILLNILLGAYKFRKEKKISKPHFDKIYTELMTKIKKELHGAEINFTGKVKQFAAQIFHVTCQFLNDIVLLKSSAHKENKSRHAIHYLSIYDELCRYIDVEKLDAIVDVLKKIEVIAFSEIENLSISKDNIDETLAQFDEHSKIISEKLNGIYDELSL